MSLTIRDLVGDEGIDRIVRGMADHQLVHLPGSGSSDPSDLFSTRDLEFLLLRDGASPSIEAEVDGEPASLESLGARHEGRLRHLTLNRHMRRGLVLIVNEAQRFVPGLWDIVCDAERVFRDPASLSIVSATGGRQRSRRHRDQSDRIVIQLEGQSEWCLDERADGAAGDLPPEAPAGEPAATIGMRPGDVLFVPAGMLHRFAAGDRSLHLALTIEHATLSDLVKHVLAQHPTLYRPLRDMRSTDALAQQVASLGREVVRHLQVMDATSWLADWKASRARVTRLDLRGQAEPAGDDRPAADGAQQTCGSPPG